MLITQQGDVLLVWDKRAFEKIDVTMGQFSVNVLLRGVVNGFEWACTGVYGPFNDSQQGALWELAKILLVWALSLIGDFNLIRYPSERIG